MRIAYLASGAGGMYCGSCLHGNTLATALVAAGQDLMMLPLYTPLKTDEQSPAVGHVAMGGLNVYLQQKHAFFRRAPRWLDRLLDSPALLRWIGKMGSSTRAEQLGPLTVSVLKGEEGWQCREVEKLIGWLQEHHRPDVVHLSNVLLVGLAKPIGRALGVPVVCSLTGEDDFLEKIPPPHYGEARRLLAERSGDLAALVALNHYYADFMAEYLPVPRTQIKVIRPGLNLAGHARPGELGKRGERSPTTIGYLARISPEKGLHLLAEAFATLCRRPGMPPLALRAAGYLASADRGYLNGIEAMLARQGLADRFEYVGELDRSEKIAFLQSLDVMSLPTVYRESKGISVFEAWANGVPVVLPQHGAFPEMLADTGGGIGFAPHDTGSLAESLARMLLEPGLAAECGRRGQEAVHRHYRAERMAAEMVELYASLVA